MMTELITLFEVILIDLIFAGDNAIAVGLVAAGLPKEQRSKVISIGVAGAVVLRIIFAVATVQLLKIPGLLVLGGLLLLWVCWHLFSDLRKRSQAARSKTAKSEYKELTFKQALYQIIAADVSMSLDNVLAVAGIAREHLYILIFGLVLSVALMLVAATYIADLLSRYRWIAYVGIAIIFYVSVVMLWEGTQDIIAMLNQA